MNYTVPVHTLHDGDHRTSLVTVDAKNPRVAAAEAKTRIARFLGIQIASKTIIYVHDDEVTHA